MQHTLNLRRKKHLQLSLDGNRSTALHGVDVELGSESVRLTGHVQFLLRAEAIHSKYKHLTLIKVSMTFAKTHFQKENTNKQYSW